MHKVCARINFEISWSYDVLHDLGIPKTTNLLFLDGQNKRYELNKLTDKFDSIWKWLQFEYWNYVRVVHYRILHVTRFPMVYYL
jgi:hypothetical protein